MKVAVAGVGAFGRKHLDGIRKIDGVEAVAVTDSVSDLAARVAEQYGIEHVAADLDEILTMPGVDAVILATPTPLHAAQSIRCMDAGKHVEVEIPLADSLADARAVLDKQKETGLVCQVGHTRRYNPSHQWIHNKVTDGELTIQQLDVQTYFFRRTNLNAEGEPRSWTDHLLWHHAAHTIDLFQYQTGERVVAQHAMQGPLHPDLGIAMDMSIQLRTESGILCTLSLSFNNDGPLGTFFRYICDSGTYLARYDDLFDGYEKPIDVSKVDVSLNGIELQDREFFAAIAEARESRSSVANVFPCYATLHELEQTLNP